MLSCGLQVNVHDATEFAMEHILGHIPPPGGGGGVGGGQVYPSNNRRSSISKRWRDRLPTRGVYYIQGGLRIAWSLCSLLQLF